MKIFKVGRKIFNTLKEAENFGNDITLVEVKEYTQEETYELIVELSKYVKKEEIAKLLDVTRQTVLNIINKKGCKLNGVFFYRLGILSDILMKFTSQTEIIINRYDSLETYRLLRPLETASYESYCSIVDRAILKYRKLGYEVKEKIVKSDDFLDFTNKFLLPNTDKVRSTFAVWDGIYKFSPKELEDLRK